MVPLGARGSLGAIIAIVVLVVAIVLMVVGFKSDMVLLGMIAGLAVARLTLSTYPPGTRS